MRYSLLLLFALILVLAACSREDNDESSETDVEQESAATVEPSPTESPTPTPTPDPTATSEPTASPTPDSTATPESTATPVPERERSTLTNEPMSEPPPRPIAVRIDNSPNARPQTGIAEADLVYEAPTEGSLTRFLAMFQTSAPEEVGPARSARLMDIDVIPLHDAMIAYSGASTGVQDRLWQAGFPLLHLDGNAGEASWRDDARYAPHNLYASIPALRDVAAEFGWEREAENVPFTFGNMADSGSPEAGVAIPYTSGNVEFLYNEDTDSYDRYVNGAEDRDGRSDAIVSPRNVILIWAPFFTGDIAPNTRGEISNNVDLYGSGSAWVLRNGQRYEVEWRRDEQSQPFRFYDQQSGEEIALAEGKIWINLLPLDMSATAVE